MEEEKNEDAIITPKTIDVYSQFVAILKGIHTRLIAEGYIIKDGTILKSERLEEYEADNIPPKKYSSRSCKRRVVD